MTVSHTATASVLALLQLQMYWVFTRFGCHFVRQLSLPTKHHELMLQAPRPWSTPHGYHLTLTTMSLLGVGVSRG